MAIERDERPWGFYEVVDESADHRVKRISVRPGQRLSYQRHALRSEHWYVVSGTGLATLDGDELALRRGVSVDVPVGCAHRVANTGAVDLVFVEVQTGTSFGEDDIERLCDDYGRVATSGRR